MRISSVWFVMLLAIALPAVADDAASPNAAAGPCSLAGTWYGGSDPAYPFIWTNTPIAGNRYTTYAEAGADNLPYGYKAQTGWLGEMARDNDGVYHSWGLSYWVWDPDAATAAGVDSSLPELDIVHSTIALTDCNTMTSTIDTYAAYFTFNPSERSPFIDAPDLDFLEVLGLTTLVETYHRMPRLADIDTQRTPRIPQAAIGDRTVPKIPRRR